MSSCSICLNSFRKTRSTKELKCGHLFHKKCIESWEERGNETCPLCRKNTSDNDFRVTLTIENLRKNNHSVVNLSLSDIQQIIDRLGISPDEMDADIVFDVEDLENLQSVVSDFGITLSDIDSPVLNTE